MTTLIVQLPPRDPAVPSQEWQLPDLPFLLLDKQGRTQRAGRASLALLPRATRTVLMLAARDLLMLAATIPPLKGPRLRQALPNVIEDHLIQDAQTCHIALDPAGPIDGKRVIAVIDRGWFRFICDAFRSAGHTSLRAVPVTRCLPQPGAVQHGLDKVDSQAAAGAALPRVAAGDDAGPSNIEAGDEPSAPAHLPIVAAILGNVVRTEPAALLGEPGELAGVFGPHCELALARGALGEGFAVPVNALEPTLAALAADAPVTLYRLTEVPGSEPHASRGGNDAAAPTTHVEALPLTFETLAHNALAQEFDLCQFEFAPQLWNLSGATLARWRLPIALALASIVVAVIGVNVQWLMLARQRDAINAQMTELLLSAFPKTTVVLDPADQMTRQLDQLRLAAGEPAPDDFLSLADALARSLGPVPSNTIAQLDYRNRSLEVTFKPSVAVDDGLTQRLARHGVTGEMDTSTGKWTIRSAR
ncbi:type II secretion system protein GspL [Mycetohabitans sp. B8]|uniref:type II secretion system protein GspL n=1 Tax=Mycetohabitans sp. B8 TaxID=2841845 RepID=UPI001F02618B|nr:type II secretion system protein GspL [Mycetohabitans sp. B8]MCG1041156.1 type II secretion system protein GspL [Mycetohabitans sp. B8]